MNYPTCTRCHRPLKNPKWREIGMGAVCYAKSKHARETSQDNNEFSDRPLQDAPPPSQTIVIKRDTDGTVLTNVPHLVTHHSPTGFEFGYGGSGVADLALNIIEFALHRMGHKGERTDDTWKKDTIFRRTQFLYQAFKWQFLASMDNAGGEIPMSDVISWIESYSYEQREAGLI